MRLCDLGHVTRATVLRSHPQLMRALGAGEIVRAARGVYVCAHLDELALLAARTRTRIDCVSALERNGVWAGQGPRGTHLRARPRHHAHAPATLHWAAARPTDGLEVHPEDALLQAMRCLPPVDALAALESAVHTGYLARIRLDVVLAAAPQYLLPTLSLFDGGGQSGLETHVRCGLIAAGHRVITQVRVPGVSPLDLLVDDVVGIETDGRQHHAESFLRDRTKDLVLEGYGIRVLRIGARHVFDEWPDTLATVQRMVRETRRRPY